MKSASPLIELKEASYTYEGSVTPALDSLSLTIDRGDYLAVVGANGSGKSTFLRLLDGLKTPQSGAVFVGGLDTAASENWLAVRRAVALVFQSPVDEIVSSVVEEDVAFGPENLGLSRPEIARRVDASLAAVGLDSERGRPSLFLSGGQQQRLAIAGALAMEPSCVAFDEATSMLDPPSRLEVLDLIDRLVEGGMTVVHVTHDMAEASRARRVVALDRGRLAFDGPAEAFFEPGSDGSAPPALALGLPLPGASLVAFALGLPPRARETAGELARRIAARKSGELARRGEPFGKHVAQAGGAEAKSGEGSEAAFALAAVSYSYLKGTSGEHAALKDVALSLPEGAVVALVGRTGSGKSTLLQLLDGLSFPSSGRVVAFGEDTQGKATDIRALRLKAPLSIQRPESALFETYAGDDVAYGPRNMGLKGPALVERVRASMESVGLPFEAYRDRITRGLSGGEKRKLALAGVLALEPRALLLDEPTSALDPETKKAVDKLLFGKGRGVRTTVFASHSMEEAALADLVVVILSGAVVASGPPERIFYDSFNPGWGIGRPFACELALELSRAGLSVGQPLDLESLIASLSGSAEGKAMSGSLKSPAVGERGGRA